MAPSKKKKRKIKAILCVQRGILLIATMRQVVLIKQVFPRHNVSVVPWLVFVLTLLGNVPLRLENESSVFVLKWEREPARYLDHKNILRQINFRSMEVDHSKTDFLKTFPAYVPLGMSLSTTSEFENYESNVKSTGWETK